MIKTYTKHVSGKKVKYDIVSNELRRRILDGDYPVGEKLPSQKEIMQEFNVSLGTLRQSFAVLQQDGLISGHQGKGVYVQTPNEINANRETLKPVGIGIYSKETSDRGTLELLQHLNNTIHNRSRNMITEFFGRKNINYKKVFNHLKGTDGIILFDYIPEEVIEQKPKDMHAVIIGEYIEPDITVPNVSVLKPDVESAGYMAAQMLILNNHKQIGLILQQTTTTFYNNMKKGFERACREAGIKGEIIIVPVHDSGKLAVTSHELISSEITGLVVVGDERGCELMDDMAAENCFIPHDKSLVVIGGLDIEYRTGFKFSRINLDLENWAQKAVSCLLDDKKEQNIVLPVKVERGDTIKML